MCYTLLGLIRICARFIRCAEYATRLRVSHTNLENCKPKSAYLARPCHILLLPRTKSSTSSQYNDGNRHTIYTLSVRSSFGGWNGLLGKQGRMKLYLILYSEYGFAQHNCSEHRQNLTVLKACVATAQRG